MSNKNRTNNTKAFLEKVKVMYNSKFNYSLVEYINSRTKVKVVCPDHGVFEITPAHHSNGHACTMCTYYGSKSPTENFIDKATKVHKDNYNYNLTEYVSSHTKVTISCSLHGEYRQTPYSHLSGAGCPTCGILTCAKNRLKTTKNFIDQAKDTHQDRYNYEDVTYKGQDVKVKILCELHGIFEQDPKVHLQGCGCPKCGDVLSADAKIKGRESFIEASIKLHGDCYDYSEVLYTKSKEQVKIICKKHGVFNQTVECHLQGRGCSRCGRNLSRSEDSIFNYISSLGLESVQSNRKIIKPKELDIVIPEKKIAIEYNGIRWHSEAFGRGKNYHKDKTDLCNAAGYRLIHIWEDDYLRDPEKELSFLKHTLGCSDQEKVYARKTTIREIPKNIGRDFLDLYHIQGAGNGSVYLGTYYQEELVSVTSFVFKDKKTSAELTRYVNSKTVIGGLGKVTKYFSNKYQLDITSFCDLARFNGNSYRLAGFEEVNTIPPDYKYVVGAERQHKFGWRKSSIKVKLPDVYDESLTEKQMMELANIPRIWDCGKIKFIYKYKN